MIQIIDIFLHLDKYLSAFVQNYSYFVYLLVFLVIFIETGLVFFPFLPGDSLLFAVGALAAVGKMNIWALFAILSLAAIIGDSVNYWVGHRFGNFFLSRNNRRFITKNQISMTESFYKKHGNQTIILARFVPIVRTIAPFIAGIGKMKFSSFFKYNIIGGISWVAIFLLAGFLFGNIPFVKTQIHWVIVGIIIVSLIPLIWRLISSKRSS